ncbi:potassium transporter [Hahella sp. CCB-MM4]|uniref:saccharopine dehydrogenase family protein n=1 Tax=Hahella sp. (strain CCB-MM4) TaxID=1926491 RepID=UPI000B9B596D|nr:saccharopine dehydrogenase NADP-binding domain-containing protein [Hahella sp. CCB-MM4]OZG73016.1 potassium transporter [Hahella sp. CCB-MM4]
MPKRILIIGGYGNFGRFISGMLAREQDLQLIIAGRDIHKARSHAAALDTVHPAESVCIDIHGNLTEALAEVVPDIVIHTSGPYQSQGYDVARACIGQGCHYIDLADARAFVAGINQLDDAAKARNVLVCSGASSVPTLTSAIIDAYISQFERLESVDYGIATAQLTNRGLATTAAVLSYAGKPFKTLRDGKETSVYGWLGLRNRRFWGLNKRMLGNCDIPDLALFPKYYPTLKNIRFQAGLELKFLHLVLFALSGLARIKLFPPLQPMTPYLLKIARLFDPFGKDNTGFFMDLKGEDDRGHAKRLLFEIVARHGDGLYIPSIPSILMAIKLARGKVEKRGAMPCIGLITLDEYLNAMRELDIEWRVVTDSVDIT